MHRKSPIAVDFDGTIVVHKYPEIGEIVPGAKETINILAENGHKVFLWTMRAWNRRNPTVLEEAAAFCEDTGIKLHGINSSPQQFSNSKKQYASIYIDDAAAGCPLCNWKGESVCDWYQIASILYNREYITNEQLTEIHNAINTIYESAGLPYQPYPTDY